MWTFDLLCFLAMGMGLCVAFIAFVRLPSLKVSTLLLTGLLIYDVFWVFFSSYIFNTNVMVKVRYCTMLYCIVIAVWMMFPVFCVCVYLHVAVMSPELSKIQSSSFPQTLKEGFYVICNFVFSICRHSTWNIRRV